MRGIKADEAAARAFPRVAPKLLEYAFHLKNWDVFQALLEQACRGPQPDWASTSPHVIIHSLRSFFQLDRFWERDEGDLTGALECFRRVETAFPGIRMDVASPFFKLALELRTEAVLHPLQYRGSPLRSQIAESLRILDVVFPEVNQSPAEIFTDDPEQNRHIALVRNCLNERYRELRSLLDIPIGDDDTTLPPEMDRYLNRDHNIILFVANLASFLDGLAEILPIPVLAQEALHMDDAPMSARHEQEVHQDPPPQRMRVRTRAPRMLRARQTQETTAHPPNTYVDFCSLRSTTDRLARHVPDDPLRAIVPESESGEVTLRWTEKDDDISTDSNAGGVASLPRTPPRRRLQPLRMLHEPSAAAQIRIGDKRSRRRRTQWQDVEVEALKEGVRLFGEGKWRDIWNAHHGIFSQSGRTLVDLKDKWRNLKRKG